MSNQRILVCRADELEPGAFRRVEAGSRQIVVVCTGEDTYGAVTDTCPHEGARLSDGRIERVWTCSDGNRLAQGSEYVIVCPWHNFEFELSTGNPPFRTGERQRPRVKCHRVVREGDEVVLYH